MGETYHSNLLSHLIQKFGQQPYTDNSFDFYFNTISEFRLLNGQKNIGRYVALINEKLQRHNTRFIGLLLLENLIDDCDFSIYDEYCLQWACAVIRIVEETADSNIWIFSTRVATSLLVEARNFPEISRDLSNTYVPLLINTLLKRSNETFITKENGAILVALTKTIQYFPKVCLPFMSKIEQFVIKELSQNRNSEYAAKCYAKLSLCGGIGTNGQKHSDLWLINFKQVLGSMYESIYNIYSSHAIAKTIDFDVPTYKITFETCDIVIDTNDAIPTNVSEPTLFSLEQRFHTLAKVAKTILRQNNDFSVNMPINTIIKLVDVIFSINPTHFKNQVSKNFTIACILPRLYINTLMVLDSLIECCKDLLLPQTRAILNLLMLTLDWSKSDSRDHKLYSKLRIAVYKTLSTWLTCLGGGCSLEIIHHDLIQHISSDIKQCKIVAKLDSEAKNLEPANKKKRSSLGITSTTAFTVTPKVSKNIPELIISAFKVLRKLIMQTGYLLTDLNHRNIQEIVIRMVLDVQTKSSGKVILPYNDPEVLRSMYNTLVSLALLKPPEKSTCCLSSVIQLLNKAMVVHKSMKVISLCQESNLILQNVAHARAPSLSCSSISMSLSSASESNASKSSPKKMRLDKKNSELQLSANGDANAVDETPDRNSNVELVEHKNVLQRLSDVPSSSHVSSQSSDEEDKDEKMNESSSSDDENDKMKECSSSDEAEEERESNPPIAKRRRLDTNESNKSAESIKTKPKYDNSVKKAQNNGIDDDDDILEGNGSDEEANAQKMRSAGVSEDLVQALKFFNPSCKKD